MLDPVLLTWLKDVGIATAILLVLGRIMVQLVQAAIEFFRGVREDNRERNRQVQALLAINQAIAGQMALTREAIERSAHSSERQEQAIQSNVDEVATLQEQLVSGLDRSRAVMADEVAALHRELAGMERLDTKLDQTRTSLASALQQVLDRLDELGSQIQATRADILHSLEQAVETRLDTPVK